MSHRAGPHGTGPGLREPRRAWLVEAKSWHRGPAWNAEGYTAAMGAPTPTRPGHEAGVFLGAEVQLLSLL